MLRSLKLLFWAFPVGLLVTSWFMVKDLQVQKAQIALRPVIESEFGFEAGSVFVFENQLKGQRVVIEAVKPGGRFERAGFQAGDVILDELKTGQFYQLIDSSRGGAVEFRVVHGGSGPPLSERAVRQVKLLVSPASGP